MLAFFIDSKLMLSHFWELFHSAQNLVFCYYMRHAIQVITMEIQNYFKIDNNIISYTRQQASDFAKQVAGDFNPIHDSDAKMFCVPGDLLFATVLNQYGLSKKMNFTFSGMVTDDSKLDFSPTTDDQIVINDNSGKQLLTVDRLGEISVNKTLIENLSRAYVEFSGKTFPDILVPLMSDKNVMINVSRPLVVYESMMIELDTLDIEEPNLELANATLEVNGKRGKACLEFAISENGTSVGKGQKKIVLSGLREFDQEQIDNLINFYTERKQAS